MTKAGRSVVLAVALGLAGNAGAQAAAQARKADFEARPAAAKAGRGAKLTFSITAPADVEVAVLDAKGKVVRHLAAGALGGPNPPPQPLRPGLSQALEWDGNDDLGKPAADGPARFRVRIGMGLRLGGFIGDTEAEPADARVYGLATDDRGLVYAAYGIGYGDRYFTIKAYDRDGKYVRTIFPYPANLKLDEVAGFAPQTPRDGRLNPPQFNGRLPWIYPGSMGGLMGNRVSDGVLRLTDGSGRLCRLRASDGACVSWGGGKPPAPAAQGPVCWAASPDGKTLYLAGWAHPGRGEPDGQIFKVDAATGERARFAKIDVPADSFWLAEKNGWYHFTNWGRKNGISAFHGLAVDGEGRVYACDRVNHRVAVYDPEGKLLGSTPVEHPDHVALGPERGELYVTTRKVLDGYKARNEIAVLRLSGWNEGKVAARLVLNGTNAPSMAVDASRKPAVIWLSNVDERGGVTRIEDRGAEFAVTGRLGKGAWVMPVKVWADPFGDDVITSNGWSALSRFNGLTGEPRKFPILGMDLAFGPDGSYHVYGQKGWHELVARFDRDFNPLPFPATGKNTTTMAATGKDVYGRYGHGWCNKGLAVGPDGRIYVYNMYDWNKYFINVWDASGKAEKHGRVADGLIGPLDPQGGGVAVDFKGNVYVGMAGLPPGVPGGAKGVGSVVKFGPEGGGYGPGGGEAGIEWKGSSVGKRVEGGLRAYPGLALQTWEGCVCKEARFDLDGYGRLYVPNAAAYSVGIVDNAGNEIARFGHYGNADSRGRGSAIPDPPIPFGFPMAVSAGQIEAGRLYVADLLNQRVARLDVVYGSEESCPAR